MSDNPVPIDARSLLFCGDNGKRGTIQWWRTSHPEGSAKAWAWQALGRSEFAASEKDALTAARRWIRDGSR